MTDPRPTPWLRRFTKLVAASTLFLIFAGAMVTSTGSGLAVPDWPLSYGMLFPPMVGGIFYEHGHRMVAATVGLLTVIQAIWLQRRDPRRFLRRLGWISVAAVILQGLLGGITVKFFLPPAISISHAGLAEIFLCLNVAIAFFSSSFYSRQDGREIAQSRNRAIANWNSLTRGSAALVLVVYLQIMVGALMRHLQAGLAIPDFPLSFGRLVPDFVSTAVAVNFAHRLGAMFVTLLIFGLTATAWRSGSRAVRTTHAVLIAAVIAQIALGAATVWSDKNPMTTSLHVVTGAFIMASSFIFALTSFTLTRDERASAVRTRHAASATPREAVA